MLKLSFEAKNGQKWQQRTSTITFHFQRSGKGTERVSGTIRHIYLHVLLSNKPLETRILINIERACARVTSPVLAIFSDEKTLAFVLPYQNCIIVTLPLRSSSQHHEGVRSHVKRVFLYSFYHDAKAKRVENHDGEKKNITDH